MGNCRRPINKFLCISFELWRLELSAEFKWLVKVFCLYFVTAPGPVKKKLRGLALLVKYYLYNVCLQNFWRKHIEIGDN